MGSFIDRFGRDAVARMQLDNVGCDPLVTDDFPALADSGPADGLAALLVVDAAASEEDDAYWRELHLHQLAEGGGVDYDDADASSWTYRNEMAPTQAQSQDSFLASARSRLEADFGRIIGRLR